MHFRPFNNIAKRYVFVLTDGLSSDRTLTNQRAEELKQWATRVIAVGKIYKPKYHLKLLKCVFIIRCMTLLVKYL